MTARLEQMLLEALLDNSETLHAEAQAHATEHNLTQNQIDTACDKVTSWLRFHGITKLRTHERSALIRIQSFFRKYLVRKRLFEQLHFWTRLAKTDCLEHMKHAEKIYNVLNPKKFICI